MYVTELAEKLLNTNGPVPTGFVFVYVAGSVIVDQMCCGRIASSPEEPSVPYRMLSPAGVSGFENLKTTVFGPVAVTDASEVCQTPLRSSAG